MKRLEDSPSFGNFPCDEHEVLRYAEGRFVGYRGFDKPGGPTPLFRTSSLAPFRLSLAR